jgi:hypothetical protein
VTSDEASATPRLIDDVRGVRYGEIIAVFARHGHFEAEVFGTQFLNDCPQELWEQLDPIVIAAELGALAVKFNGPRHWVIDGIGQKVNTIEPILREFGGLLMRRLAVIDLGDEPTSTSYTDNFVHRGAVFFFDAGKPVHELIAPDGRVYVMQAYCLAVDPTTNAESLLSLGQRLHTPKGWSYRVRILEEELVVDTTDKVATVLQDEFEHSYTLPE